MPLERLQKIIARGGTYSRRQAEELIRSGDVFVNNRKITELGTKADPQKDKILVKGKWIGRPSHLTYLLFHKPRRCLVTRDDPEGRKTIYDFLPAKFRGLKPVGRLDYHSEGLLLLTDDGELANRLTHPRFHLSKIYEVKLHPKPTPRQLERIGKGIMLDGRKTLPVTVKVIHENPSSTWIQMELTEGRNRQIRRMCEAVGLTVKTLVRTRLGPFSSSGIPPGKWRILEKKPL